METILFGNWDPYKTVGPHRKLRCLLHDTTWGWPSSPATHFNYFSLLKAKPKAANPSSGDRQTGVRWASVPSVPHQHPPQLR